MLTNMFRLLSQRLLRSSCRRGCEDGEVFAAPVLDAEKRLLGMIKVQCGNSSVVKIEGMLNDLYVTETINDNFTTRQLTVHPEEDDEKFDALKERERVLTMEYDAETKGAGLNSSSSRGVPVIRVILLTQNFWPNVSNGFETSNTILPAPMGKKQHFLIFYIDTICHGHFLII